MSIFFLLNYRLFSLLEREDWPALAYYLEKKVYVKGRYSDRNVRLLASSYLIISDYVSALKLENKAQFANPSVISKNVLLFGSARVLNGNPAEASAFFKTHLEKCKTKDRFWVQWFIGFTELLSGSFIKAEPEFTSLAFSANNPLITGLSAYFLNSSIEKKSQNPDKCRLASKKGKDRVINELKKIENWKKEAEKYGTDIHIAIIKKYIDETGKWLWSN